MVLGLLVSPGMAQIPEGLGQGWEGEFGHATRQLLQLAEAIPAEKYAWRPGKGVRSTSEVLMHVAVGNYFLLNQAEAKIPDDTPSIGPGLEAKVKDKKEVIEWMKRSFAAVKGAYPAADGKKQVKFFGRDTTVEGVYLRILVHQHEHMGQMIGYARMMGVTPPWSKGAE